MQQDRYYPVNRETSHHILGGVLVAAAIVTAASIGAHIRFGAVPSSSVILLLAFPGRFLFASFHGAAFLLPTYLGVLAILTFLPRRLPGAIVAANLSVFPLFTLGILLRILFDPAAAQSPVTSFFITSFSGRGGAFLLVLALALELIAIVYVVIGITADESRSDRNEEDLDELEPDPLDATPLSLPAPESGREFDYAWLESPDASEEHDDLDEADEEYRVFFTDGRVTDDPAAFDVEPIELVPIDHDEEDDDFAVELEADDQLEDDDIIDDEDVLDDDDDLDIPTILDVSRIDDDVPIAPPPAKRPGRKGAKKYAVPIRGLLDEYPDGQYWVIDDDTRTAAEVLRVTLEEFQIQAEVTGIRKGPVITMFEILPAPGVKLARITNLSDNIALRMAASSVRIVAPIPGKHAVGIEIPNKRRNIVSFGELVGDPTFQRDQINIPIALGKDIPGDAQIIDLTKTPHLLIAGATGSGKSVCVNSIICSILYRRTPQEVKMILIDPKIVELKFYNDIPHLLTPVITDPKRAFQALQYCIYEMERRYTLLDALAVRDITSFNAKIEKKNLAMERLPYIVVVVDEFADLMATSGKELETTLARLAAMSRAVGIHLVLATQRPSTDVITGLIKANIPSRIAFMVASKVDSRIILDTMGAEKLLGRGDMLFTSAWDPFPFRIQGAFLSEDEVERVVAHVKTLGEPEYIDDEIFIEDDDEAYIQEELEDPLMEKAIQIVVSAKKASASYLQRRLKIGYNRAARLVEEMERVGIVGPQNGSKPRDILSIPENV